MSYFDEILKNRNLETCPRYLWQLKLNEQEYSQLKEILQNVNSVDGFDAVARECTLFFAEYWKREYYGGPHSKEMVVNAISEKFTHNADLKKSFFQAACRGASLLKLELIRGDQITPYLNSLLYQGGLPMRLVTCNVNEGNSDNNTYNRWENFTRNLVHNRINFDNLDLGIAANQSTSIREFCQQLISGIDTEKIEDMPFYCIDTNNIWYTQLISLAREERKRQNNHHPFSLDWEFSINEIDRVINLYYIFLGKQNLPKKFIEEQNIDNKRFTAEFKINGICQRTFIYNEGFCRHCVRIKEHYTLNDQISLNLDHQEIPYLADEIDLTTPHVLCCTKTGKYKLGNKLGVLDSLILIPEGWTLEGPNCDLETYTIDNYSFKCLKLNEDFNGSIILTNGSDSITFGRDSTLYWTDFIAKPVHQKRIYETIYDCANTQFRLCHEVNDNVHYSKNVELEYLSKGDNQWKSSPAYGEILVRAKRADCYVTPVKILNIGNELRIHIIEANETSCVIEIVWPHGDIFLPGGIKIGNNWQITRDHLNQKNAIELILTPQNNGKNPIHLSIKPPFKEFNILSPTNQAIDKSCSIPFEDIDHYQYHLLGQNICYSYNGIKSEVECNGNSLSIVKRDPTGATTRTDIPYEGSLPLLFESKENMERLLEKNSQNLLNSSIDISFWKERHNRNQAILKLTVKEYPFIIEQQEENEITINDQNQILDNYQGDLKLFDLSNPFTPPILFNRNENNKYILPVGAADWQKCLLTGAAFGRILPKLVTYNSRPTPDERKQNRTEAIQEITNQLNNAKINDAFWRNTLKWFELTQTEAIPASSILQLQLISQSPAALVCFAFQLYIRNRDVDELSSQLDTFSSELGFQWFWLKPYLTHTAMILVKHTDSSKEGFNLQEYLQNISSFNDWMLEICKFSMTRSYDSYTDDEHNLIKQLAEEIMENKTHIIGKVNLAQDISLQIDENQENLDESTKEYFHQFTENDPAANIDKLLQRVNVVARHLNRQLSDEQDIDSLFNCDEKIRRSIIYYMKSFSYQFIISLNNRLTHEI